MRCRTNHGSLQVTFVQKTLVRFFCGRTPGIGDGKQALFDAFAVGFQSRLVLSEVAAAIFRFIWPPRCGIEIATKIRSAVTIAPAPMITNRFCWICCLALCLALVANSGKAAGAAEGWARRRGFHFRLAPALIRRFHCRCVRWGESLSHLLLPAPQTRSAPRLDGPPPPLGQLPVTIVRWIP